MAISPQSAVKQLRKAFPNRYKYATDEQVYRIARAEYPNEPIMDWPEIGYITKKTPKEDPADIFLQRTDEDSFMDTFNLYGIDEDSSYLARLAYSRSLQGMTEDLLRGKPKFDNLRQPALWEEAVAGIMAFAMPMDALSLFTGGAAAKVLLKAGFGKWVSKYATKKVLQAAPGLAKSPGGKAAVESSIRNIIGTEMMYVPYEGAKANMYAQTQHMRDPSIEPLSSSEILKETMAGIVHGGIMGVMGGSARPFLAAKHAKYLKAVERLELQKKLSGTSKQTLFKLKNAMRYTGNLGQYATDVGGLTLGDITGTAVAYGQIKSGEEMLASLLTMGGFAGATRGLGFGLHKVAIEPLENAKKIYKKKWNERAKQIEKEEALQNSINEKSIDQLDSDAEIKAKESSFSDGISDAEKRRQKWEDSEEYKEYLQIKRDVEIFDENNKRKIREGKPIDAKEAMEFYQERGVHFARVRNYFDEAGEMLNEIEDLDRWLELGNESALKSLEIKKGDLSASKITLLNKLEDEGINTIRLDVKDEGGVKRATDVNLNEVESVIKKENPDFTNEEVLQETIFQLQNRYDIKQGSKAARPVDDKAANEVIQNLNKSDDQIDASIKSFLDMGEAGEDVVINYRTAKKIKADLDSELENIKTLDLTESELNAARQNILLAQTFITSKLPEFTMKSATGAGSKIDKKRLTGYAKGVINLYKKFRGAGEDVALGNINPDKLRTYVGNLSGDAKSGVIAFYRFLSTNDAVSVGVKNTIDELFKLVKLVPQPKKIGMEISSFKFDKNAVTITYPMGKAKGLRLAGIVASRVKATISGQRTYRGLMEDVIELSKKIKIPGLDEATKKPITVSVPFFAFTKAKLGDKLKPKAIGTTSAGKLSQAIFGVNLKEFRKGESTFVAGSKGITSNDFLLLDSFGLGHIQLNKTDISKAGKHYIAQLKIDKNTGLPTSKNAFNTLKQNKATYQRLIFDGKTSVQLEKMSNAKLKKYGLSKNNLNYSEGISIYQLKKGYEKLDKIVKSADKKGYLYFNDKGSIITNPEDKSIKMSIHKDVLEGLFRTFSETSARVNDIVATTGNKKGVPVTDSGVFISRSLENLAKKMRLNIKDDTGLKSINFETLTQEPKDKFKKSALTRNSFDNIKTLKSKARILITGGRHGDYSRANLGNRQYERNLKIILKHYGMTDADIGKMKKISLDDNMVDEGILSRILEDMECK